MIASLFTVKYAFFPQVACGLLHSFVMGRGVAQLRMPLVDLISSTTYAGHGTYDRTLLTSLVQTVAAEYTAKVAARAAERSLKLASTGLLSRHLISTFFREGTYAFT